jgi:hypothetical protein
MKTFTVTEQQLQILSQGIGKSLNALEAFAINATFAQIQAAEKNELPVKGEPCAENTTK